MTINKTQIIGWTMIIMPVLIALAMIVLDTKDSVRLMAGIVVIMLILCFVTGLAIVKEFKDRKN